MTQKKITTQNAVWNCTESNVAQRKQKIVKATREPKIYIKFVLR